MHMKNAALYIIYIYILKKIKLITYNYENIYIYIGTTILRNDEKIIKESLFDDKIRINKLKIELNN